MGLHPLPARAHPRVRRTTTSVTGTPRPQDDAIASPEPKRRSTRRRVLLGVGWAFAALLGLALLLYLFGGPGGATPEVRAEYEELVRTGTVLPVEDRFVVPVPGCTCHSDDALLIVQHAERRIRDCFGGCH